LLLPQQDFRDGVNIAPHNLPNLYILQPVELGGIEPPSISR